MSNPRSFTIHKSKKSLVDKLMTARQSLVKDLDTMDHRLETVDEIYGVTYINDSKAHYAKAGTPTSDWFGRVVPGTLLTRWNGTETAQDPISTFAVQLLV